MAKTDTKITPEIAAKIKALLNETDWTQAQIAAHLGAINQGRVSDVKAGKIHANVPPCDIRDALRPV